MADAPFEVGEVVYRTHSYGRKVSRHRIARATATMAFIQIREGVEERYRHDGRPVGVTGFQDRPTISRPTPHLERLYLNTRRMDVAQVIESAARDFRQALDLGGDPSKAEDVRKRIVAAAGQLQTLTDQLRTLEQKR